MNRKIASIFIVLIALAASALVLVRFQESIRMQPAQARPELAGSFDFAAFFETISPVEIERWHERLTAFPSRLPGTEGDLAASRMAEAHFRELGMEVLVQRFPVTIPVTRRCALQDADGTSIDSVALLPFWPNIIRTCTTPPEGITAEVVDGGTGSIEDLDGKAVEGNILLLKMTPSMEWLDAAKLGAAAILFRPSDEPRDFHKKFLHFPANLPRFMAEGDVDALVGRRVRLIARVDWEVREARNVYGILRPKQENGEALFLFADSDAWSVVPDRAPGDYEACSMAGLMATATAFTAQKQWLGRNLIFVVKSGRCLASEGIRRLVDVLGNRETFEENYKLLTARLGETGRVRDDCAKALEAYRAGDYWELDPDVEQRLWNRFGTEARASFAVTLQGLIDRHVREIQQVYAEAKLAWVEAGEPDNGPLFEAQLGAANRLRRARSAAGADPVALKEVFGDVLDAGGCRDRLGPALETRAGRAQEADDWQQDAVDLAQTIRPFQRNYFFFHTPTPTGRSASFAGDRTLCQELERARDSVVRRWLQWQGLPANDPTLYTDHAANRTRVRIGGGTAGIGENLEMGKMPIMLSAHAEFRFRGPDGSRSYQTPLREEVRFGDVAAQSQLVAGIAAQVASGDEPMGIAGKDRAPIISWFSDYGGEIFSVGGSRSIIANRRVANALVVLRGTRGGHDDGINFYVQRTRDGAFRFPAAVPGRHAGWVASDAYTVDDRTGEITGARDMGVAGQKYPNRFRTWDFYKEPETRVTLLLDQFAPIDIFRLTGTEGRPLKIEMLNAQFRTAPDAFARWRYEDEGATLFARPGESVFLVLREIPLAQGLPEPIRGFLLGYGPGMLPDLERGSFWGPGYLSGRDRRVVFQEVDAATSVAAANRERLDAQVRHGLGDPASLEFAGKADRLLENGLETLAGNTYTKAYRQLTTSLAISNRAYPLVRRAVADALTGLLLYMFLLVPFAVACERLLLGTNDIRARIAGTFVIFLAVFFFIRALHPVYELVTSGMIVLVGFVIFMLCLLILGFLSGKFAERIRELRRRGGGSGEADGDVSRAGAAGTAFTLGINSMRKRKVRTAYTLITLILISFSMVCFTSPHPELVAREIVVGPSTFNGVLLRQPGDIAPLQVQFGERARILQRRGQVWEKGPPPKGDAISYIPARGAIRSTTVHARMVIDAEEPLLTAIDRILLPGGRWFESNDESSVLLSEQMATALGIDPGVLPGEAVTVRYKGHDLQVVGVFSSAALDNLKDIDGMPFLPPDETPSEIERRGASKAQSALDPARRGATSHAAPGSETAIFPANPAITGAVEQDREHTSAVVVFEDLPYGEMREMVDTVMNRLPTYFTFALDGVSFFGGKMRSVGIEGLIDLVIPLLIASFIVFNTMLGSVYERQREISVFSAVGLSPRHVFYLFLAESLVYAVIGVVGGYLLGLGLQGLSNLGGNFLGLAIDFSSRSAIFVCLTIMAAVVASTFLPAWRAARIASPSERVTWTMPPEIEPGRLDFTLPFTYLGRDILAVVPFLNAWFDARGEDASGEFTASPPAVRIDWTGDHPTFVVEATTWLRPYDLGVSQQVRIDIKPSEDPRIYVVGIAIDQLTGDLISWRRTNKRFVAILRRQLLSWRALGLRTKESLYESAREMVVGQDRLDENQVVSYIDS